MKKPFLKAGYCGILLLIISAAIIAVNPAKAGKLPHGFFNPTVAFEFIRTETEVYDLFGHIPSEENMKVVNSIENGTYLDFFYMAVYAVFLLLFTEVCHHITGERWFYFSGFIVLGVFLADFGENMQLMSILVKLPAGDFRGELTRLNFFTWAKWGGLTALFISFIPFFRYAGRFGRGIAVFSLFSAVTGAAAFMHRSILNEIYVLSIAVIFIMLIVFSFIFILKDQPDN